MTERSELIRQVGFVVADLDRRGYPLVGVVRQAAHALLEHHHVDPSTTGCRGCGQALTQPATGGRRIWCAERCRRRHRN